MSPAPTASQMPFSVNTARLTPKSANVKPATAAESSHKSTGSSGLLALRRNEPQD